MKEEIIYVHNMDSPRDVLVLRNELERLGMQVKKVELGAAAFINPSNMAAQELKKAMAEIGFRVLQKKEKVFIDQVKDAVSFYMDMLHSDPELPLLSHFLEEQLSLSYSTISKRFRRIEGRSIENYFISLKVNRIKQLLHNTDMSIKDIAIRLNYSSSKTLAKTFKEVTGFSVSAFKHSSSIGTFRSSSL